MIILLLVMKIISGDVAEPPGCILDCLATISTFSSESSLCLIFLFLLSLYLSTGRTHHLYNIANFTSELILKCNQAYPFITPIANPGGSPPVRGIPRFPVIVEICPVSVNEWASVDTSPCDID